MVFLNLLLLFCETLNRFQHNGEDTFACKRIAQWHCTNLNRQFCIENHATKTCQQTKIENPGCFPNVTNGYKGCLQHKIMDCDFPNYNANMTCNSSINYGRVPFTVPKVGDASDTVMKKLRTSGERTIGRDVCSRIQCQTNIDFLDIKGNDFDIYSFVFFILELCFMVWFLIDLTLGVFVNQNEHSGGYLFWLIKKEKTMTGMNCYEKLQNLWNRFNYDFDNIILSLATVSQTIGVIAISVFYYQGPNYTLFGNYLTPTDDPYAVRIFRVLIALRFAIMQKDVFRILSSTASRVFHKLLIPYLLFFVVALVLSTAFYVIESGDLYIDCQKGDTAPSYPWEKPSNFQTCRYCPTTANSNEAIYTKIDYSTKYNLVYGFNGSCTSYIKRPSINGEKILDDPQINDMWDSLWAMIVTMTTVGYGSFGYPIQIEGQVVAVIAALFGTFYISMPLTIVGNEFHSIYTSFRQEQQEHHEQITKALAKGHSSRKSLLRSDTKGSHKKERKGRLSFKFAGKLKIKAKNAKKRIQEKLLTKSEYKQLEEYLILLYKLPNYEILERFEKAHQNVMLIMALHLSHRSNLILVEDLDNYHEENEKEGSVEGSGETKTNKKSDKNKKHLRVSVHGSVANILSTKTPKRLLSARTSIKSFRRKSSIELED